MKKDKQSLDNKLRKNPFIVCTFVLGLFVVILLTGNLIESNNINKTENEMLCSVIYATPAWISQGRIVSYGLMIPQNMSIDLVNQVLIPERVKMLYNSDCFACEKQIGYFKEQGTWEDYQKEGLAIDCN